MKDKPTYTIIGDDTEIRGDVVTEGSITVAGTVDGDLTSPSGVRITAGGKVTGHVKAQDVYLNGTVLGGISADGRVVMSAESRLSGTLKSSRVSVEEGARFDGICDMDVSPVPAESPKTED